MTMKKIYSPALVSFHKEKEIGQEGKNSNVYLAHDEYMNAQIVIKEIPNSKKNDEVMENLFREAHILYESSHPNIVQIQYACKDEDNIYIAMPFYKNGSLKSLMKERFLTVKEIIRYGIQFISGVAHIHSKGLLHLDIKPDNILLSDTNEALLSDFGLADYTDENGWYFITKFYIAHIAPEIITNNYIVSVQFDIFQIGLTLYRMCVGDVEYNQQFETFKSTEGFQANDFLKALDEKKFPSINKFPLHIPNSLIKIISKCLESNTSKRYTNVREILNDLSKIENKGLNWNYKDEPEHYEWSCEDSKGNNYTVNQLKTSNKYTIKKGGRNHNTTKNLKSFLSTIE